MYILNMREQRSWADIRETPREQMMDDIQLRDECLKYLDTVRGRTFVNRATGRSITVSRLIRGEIISKIRVNSRYIQPLHRARLLALKNIQSILTDSDPETLDVEPKGQHSTYESSNIFKYRCRINGTDYYVRIRTVKPYNYNDRLYFMYLDDIEMWKWDDR